MMLSLKKYVRKLLFRVCLFFCFLSTILYKEIEKNVNGVTCQLKYYSLGKAVLIICEYNGD